jgi:hypothetical protein
MGMTVKTLLLTVNKWQKMGRKDKKNSKIYSFTLIFGMKLVKMLKTRGNKVI